MWCSCFVFHIYIHCTCKLLWYFCVTCYKVAATYRDHLSVCPSVTKLFWATSQRLLVDFIQTLQEWSVLSLVVHIFSIFQFNYFQLWTFNDFLKSLSALLLLYYHPIWMKCYSIDQVPHVITDLSCSQILRLSPTCVMDRFPYITPEESSARVGKVSAS